MPQLFSVGESAGSAKKTMIECPNMKETASMPNEKSPSSLREEREVHAWKDARVFEQSVEKPANTDPRGSFVFYDGPPFATGLPHYGHILASAIKDTVPRYQTMRGNRVDRQWGWDCHGLPVETIVEKLLGVSGKPEIEKLGIDRFNETARSQVLSYVGEWKKTVERMGRWVDFDGSYKTMDNSYIESVWWAVAELHKKGLLYEGKKVLLYCPRCETPVSKAEVAMDSSYKDVTEESAYVRFRIVDPAAHTLPIGTSFLAWTTTPWTLPANTALALNGDISYAICEVNGETLVVAEDRVSVLGDNYRIRETRRGHHLAGIAYEPLYAADALAEKRAYVSVLGSFVTTTDGTGIVHVAPAYGEDDYLLAGTESLLLVDTLDSSGHYLPGSPLDISGMYLKKGEKRIKEDLESRGLLFRRETRTHSYPHCWRCGTALIYRALSAWFISVQEAKARVLSANQSITWIPDHLRDGRFANIVEGAPDWNISRNRYWASPLPIWKCGDCRAIQVVGGIEDLSQLQAQSENRYYIMRHGQAESNVQARVSSRADDPNPLTEAGRAQVLDSAGHLKSRKIDLIISSDFVRTKETAQIVAKTVGYPSDKIVYDARLREVDAGDLHGKSRDDYHAYFSSLSEKFEKAPPGTEETLRGLKRRMAEFLYELDRTHKNKTILIVSHEYPLWLLTAASLGHNKEEAEKMIFNDREFIENAEVRLLPFAPVPHNSDYELDLHRPYVDGITFPCDCGAEMVRIPEVIDCWVESAAMPFASIHYPFENKKRFQQNFPADFVAEYVAQTRTWFYYSIMLSELLFGQVPFKHIVTTGTVLAEDGQKMSKSKGNFPDPWILLNTYGADALRFYLIGSPLMQSVDLNFSERGVGEVYSKCVARMENVVAFYRMNVAGSSREVTVLEQWINDRFAETALSVTDAMDRYELDLACRQITDFIDDLSVWYIRRARKQFNADFCRDLLERTARLLAPFMPFLAEDVYRAVRQETDPVSVHLSTWPIEQAPDSHTIDAMKGVRKVVEFGLRARQEAGIKVRQPLASISVRVAVPEMYQSLILDELNVKKIVVDGSISADVLLNTDITEDLMLEGRYRDLVRKVQDQRKDLGLEVKNEVTVRLAADHLPILEFFGDPFYRAVHAREVVIDSSLAPGSFHVVPHLSN